MRIIQRMAIIRGKPIPVQDIPSRGVEVLIVPYNATDYAVFAFYGPGRAVRRLWVPVITLGAFPGTAWQKEIRYRCRACKELGKAGEMENGVCQACRKAAVVV